jgi:hypothetical protein
MAHGGGGHAAQFVSGEALRLAAPHQQQALGAEAGGTEEDGRLQQLAFQVAGGEQFLSGGGDRLICGEQAGPGVFALAFLHHHGGQTLGFQLGDVIE